MIRSILTIAVITALSSVSLADTLTLKNGAELEGVVITNTQDDLVLRVVGGEISLPANMVEKIESTQLTAQTIQTQEEENKAKLAQANQSRKERVQKYLSDLEQTDTIRLQAQPASFIPAAPENWFGAQPSAAELYQTIQEKLDVLEDLTQQIQQRGIGDQARVREAILSEIFPNYAPPGHIW